MITKYSIETALSSSLHSSDQHLNLVSPHDDLRIGVRFFSFINYIIPTPNSPTRDDAQFKIQHLNLDELLS
jgi:hypothetical protein